jgi:hypothetical protein
VIFAFSLVELTVFFYKGFVWSDCLPVFIAAGGGDTSTASFVGSVIVKSN